MRTVAVIAWLASVPLALAVEAAAPGGCWIVAACLLAAAAGYGAWRAIVSAARRPRRLPHASHRPRWWHRALVTATWRRHVEWVEETRLRAEWGARMDRHRLLTAAIIEAEAAGDSRLATILIGERDKAPPPPGRFLPPSFSWR